MEKPFIANKIYINILRLSKCSAIKNSKFIWVKDIFYNFAVNFSIILWVVWKVRSLCSWNSLFQPQAFTGTVFMDKIRT